MKRLFALAAFCQLICLAQAQAPKWLVGTWERKLHTEDGDYLIRYTFSQDSTFTLGSTEVETNYTIAGIGVVLSFNNPTMRLRIDRYEFNEEPMSEESSSYEWETQVTLINSKTLRITEESKDQMGEAHKDVTYFKKVKQGNPTD